MLNDAHRIGLKGPTMRRTQAEPKAGEHLDKKILKGRLNAHIRQAVDGKKQFEEAMKLNMRSSRT